MAQIYLGLVPQPPVFVHHLANTVKNLHAVLAVVAYRHVDDIGGDRRPQVNLGRRGYLFLVDVQVVLQTVLDAACAGNRAVVHPNVVGVDIAEVQLRGVGP